MRKIDRFGVITTIAGNGKEGYNGDDILATHAQLDFPYQFSFTNMKFFQAIEFEKFYKME